MIKIKEINIINFGGITNLNLTLNDGLNVIYGTNEAGKSTVQAFIKAMFYGIGRKKKADTFSDREKYMPWSGEQMAGSLTVEYNGKDIEISRRFGKTASSDKISVTDKISGEAIPELNVSAPGEIILGMTCQMFEKTLWIGQGGACMSGTDEEITAKLMNLSQTNDEEISHINAIEKLKEKKAALKAESKRNKPGLIDNIDMRLEELEQLKLQLEEKRRERMELESVKEQMLAEQVNKKQTLEIAEKAKQAERDAEKIHRAEQLKEYLTVIEEIKNADEYIRFADCNSKELDEVESLYMERDGVRSEISKYEVLEDSFNDDTSIFTMKNQHKKMTLMSYILLALGVIALFIFWPIGIVLVMAAVAVFLLGFMKKKTYTEKIEKMQHIKADYEDNLRELRLRLNGYNTRLDVIFEKRQVKDLAEYKSLYNKYVVAKAKLDASITAFDGLIGDDNYEQLILEAVELSEQLKGVDLSEYKDIDCDAIRQRMLEIAKQLSDIENKLNYEYSEQISNMDIENEIISLVEKRKQASLEIKALDVAIAGIEEAYSNLRTEFGPAINKNVNEIVAFLTDGKYTDFRVSDDYRMKINYMGETKETEYLSTGTYEQIYLALRLGIAKLVLGDSGIIFLDDAFSAYDDVRSKKAIELIKNFAENSQALLLSCHERDKNNAAKLSGVNVIAL